MAEKVGRKSDCFWYFFIAEISGSKTISQVNYSKGFAFLFDTKEKLCSFKSWIKTVYNGLDVSFETNKDLAIVWITGFKPRGDDSRPDRGLSPLCRMILGRNANIMAVVSGPGKGVTWSQLLDNAHSLCEKNGLFQAIFSCCNYLFVDSATCHQYIFTHTDASFTKNKTAITFPYIASPVVEYFEHDTDCAIHQIFSSHQEIGLFECFCNPPGGDWSGISFFWRDSEYKWTSLPRVSEKSKRPDHILQIERNGKLLFVTIESKGYGKDLEDNIGDRLKLYIKDLFNSEPTAIKKNLSDNWEYYNGSIGKVYYDMLAVGAFIYRKEEELAKQLVRGNLDAIFAFEFGEVSTIHFYSNSKGQIIGDYLRLISSKQANFIVKVHRF